MIPHLQTCSSSNSSFESNNNDHHHLSMRQHSSSLISQPSLPSIPSLTSSTTLYPSRHHHHQRHFPVVNHKCIATLKGTSHGSYTSSLVLAGKFLFTGSSDKEIRGWMRNTLSPFYENLTNSMVTAGKGAVKSLVVLSNKIISAHQDHKIRVWKIDSDQEGSQKITHLATLPKISDHAIKFLNPKNHVQVRRHKTCTWVQHVDTVSALALSADESLLYSVSWDRTLKIWQMKNFKCLESVSNAHEDAINALALSDDGYVYTGSADKKIKVWKKEYGEKKHTLVAILDKHKSGINALALTPDGTVLYSGACDRSILVWEKDDEGGMTVIGALRGHTKSILCLTVIGNLIFSGSADRTIRVWSGFGRCYSCLAVLEGHNGPVKCLAAAAAASDHHQSQSDETSSYLLYSSSLDCDMKVWQVFLHPV